MDFLSRFTKPNQLDYPQDKERDELTILWKLDFNPNVLVSMNKEEEIPRTDVEKLSNPYRKGSKRCGETLVAEGIALENENEKPNRKG